MNCLTVVLVRCKLRMSGAGWRSRRPERSSETFAKNTDNTKVPKKKKKPLRQPLSPLQPTHQSHAVALN